MNVISDLHIHSKFSRATSANMNLEEVSRYAEAKGLTIVGSGDFTHPTWFQYLRDSLVKTEDTGVYRLRDQPNSCVRFIVQGEVCTSFDLHGKSRRIHHVVLCPNLESAIQVNDRLEKFGNLSVDGRPTLSMSAAELVEEIMEANTECFVFPAHIWTPWFSALGSVGGFDSIEECYEDQVSRIHAIETGLSSDPPMNWRLSALDRFVIISCSDAHSAWPWRLGREVTVLDLKELSYPNLTEALSSRDTSGISLTIETDPAYGKYHWSGHRACSVSMNGEEAGRMGGRCPKCGRKLTKGVEERVEEIADRPIGFIPKVGCLNFIHLLPLHEVIAAVKSQTVSSQAVWNDYHSLIQKFGSEYNVMLSVPRESLGEIVDPALADAIIRVREDRVYVKPGYDGVYGTVDLLREKEARRHQPSLHQKKSLLDFI